MLRPVHALLDCSSSAPPLPPCRLNQCWLKYDNPSVGASFPRFRGSDLTDEVGWLSGMVDPHVTGDEAPADRSHDCRCLAQWQYTDPGTGRNMTFKVGRAWS